MVKLKQIPASLVDLRNKLDVNQNQFWKRYGVTQSGGSRYESGRNMPTPLKLLLRLHLNGVITDADLDAAMKK